MTLKIIHKNNTSAGQAPAPSDLDIGEIAVNSADAELYTKDNDGAIRTFPNETDINASITTATTTATTFTQSGDDAVARTFVSKLKDVVSVKDFGVVGDGSADDTSSFQAALNASTSLFIPENTTIKITSTVEIPNNVNIEGANRVSSEIFVSGDINGIDLRRYSSIRNLRVRGTSSMSSSKYLVGLGTGALDSARSNIHHCIIGGRSTEIGDTANETCGGVALKGSVSFLNNITDCYLFKSYQGLSLEGSVVNAIRISGTECHACSIGAIIKAGKSVVLSQCTFENNSQQGLIIQNSQGCVLEGCYFEKNNQGTAATIKADLLVDFSDPGTHLTMSGLFFLKGTGNTEYGLYIDRQRGVSLDGAFFSAYQSATNFLYAGNTSNYGYGVLKNVYASGTGASRSITGNWQYYGFNFVGTNETNLTTLGSLVVENNLTVDNTLTATEGLSTPGFCDFGDYGIAGGIFGNDFVMLASTPPAGATMAEIICVGKDYASLNSNNHAGLLVAYWSFDTKIITTTTDINHTSGSNQGFVAVWDAGTSRIIVKNKSGMSSNQRGRAYIRYYR